MFVLPEGSARVVEMMIDTQQQPQPQKLADINHNTRPLNPNKAHRELTASVGAR
jgi:hypothetical protein